jgi:hypothetical protein
MARDPLVRRVRRGGERFGNHRDRATPGKHAQEWGDSSAGRSDAAVPDEMPARGAEVRRNRREENLRLSALEGDRAEASRAVPAEESRRRPAAEAAIRVEEQCGTIVDHAESRLRLGKVERSGCRSCA